MSDELDKLKQQAESMRCPHLIHKMRPEDIFVGSQRDGTSAIFSPTPSPLSTENARLRSMLEEASNALVCDYMCGESPCAHKAVKSEIKALLAGQPVADPREAEIARLERLVNSLTQHVNAAPHGDNCYLTKEPPGDQCVCGKDSLLAYAETVMEKASPAPQPDAVPTNRELLLGEALLSVLVAAGIVRPGMGATGPELLMFAEDYVRNSKSQPDAVRVLREALGSVNWLALRILKRNQGGSMSDWTDVKQIEKTSSAALAATEGVKP